MLMSSISRSSWGSAFQRSAQHAGKNGGRTVQGSGDVQLVAHGRRIEGRGVKRVE